VASLDLPGPEAQLVAVVVAIRAARGGVGNITGMDLASLRLGDARGAVDALRGLGWERTTRSSTVIPPCRSPSPSPTLFPFASVGALGGQRPQKARQSALLSLGRPAGVGMTSVAVKLPAGCPRLDPVPWTLLPAGDDALSVGQKVQPRLGADGHGMFLTAARMSNGRTETFGAARVTPAHLWDAIRVHQTTPLLPGPRLLTLARSPPRAVSTRAAP
jgi:hypothetical protein